MRSISNLEKLTRMLTSNFGSLAPFDEAMIAAALRSACDPDITKSIIEPFIRAVADAFDGSAQPNVKLKAGRKGRKSAPLIALGVSRRAVDIHEYVSDSVLLAVANGQQEALIHEVIRGSAILRDGRCVANGAKMARSTVMKELQAARRAIKALHSREKQRRQRRKRVR